MTGTIEGPSYIRPLIEAVPPWFRPDHVEAIRDLAVTAATIYFDEPPAMHRGEYGRGGLVIFDDHAGDGPTLWLPVAIEQLRLVHGIFIVDRAALDENFATIAAPAVDASIGIVVTTAPQAPVWFETVAQVVPGAIRMTVLGTKVSATVPAAGTA